MLYKSWCVFQTRPYNIVWVSMLTMSLQKSKTANRGVQETQLGTHYIVLSWWMCSGIPRARCATHPARYNVAGRMRAQRL